MRTTYRLLVISPGATSTKIGIYDNEKCIVEETLRHETEELNRFPRMMDQYTFRKKAILDTLHENGMNVTKFNAIVGHRGVLRPIPGGTYKVNELMLEDLRNSRFGEHASNLGAIIAYEIASQLHIPAYIVDPAVMDELVDVARITGSPLFERKSIFHSLNQKAVAKRTALELGISYESLRAIVAHMGGGISVGVHLNGKVIDVNNALGGKVPFSPERSGTVPAVDLVKLCYNGTYSQNEVMGILVGQGGLTGYLGTNNALEIEARIESSDLQAKLIYDAMAYQVAKEIGAAAAVLDGNVDVIILTGGLAYGKGFVDKITSRIDWISKVRVIPGENEFQALAEGALRVLRQEEEAKIYSAKNEVEVIDF